MGSLVNLRRSYHITIRCICCVADGISVIVLVSFSVSQYLITKALVGTVVLYCVEYSLTMTEQDKTAFLSSQIRKDRILELLK